MLKVLLMNIAPLPAPTWKSNHHRMPRLLKMPRRVPPYGGVTTSYVAAAQAESEGNPIHMFLFALLTTLGSRLNIFANVGSMFATLRIHVPASS
jgi:hypothetical protein